MSAADPGVVAVQSMAALIVKHRVVAVQSMAALIVKHRFLINYGDAMCLCGERGFVEALDDADDVIRLRHAAHVAAALSEAGIGVLADARAEGAQAVVAAVEAMESETGGDWYDIVDAARAAAARVTTEGQ